MINVQAIEAFRKKKGLGQKEIAEKLDITQSAYSNKIAKGNFDDREIDVICKTLGIKKEQIEMNELAVNELTFLTNKAIQNESALKVILSTQAEILAKLTDGNATKIRLELESAVNSLSKLALEQLRRRV